jgi:hypothetical protein
MVLPRCLGSLGNGGEGTRRLGGGSCRFFVQLAASYPLIP